VKCLFCIKVNMKPAFYGKNSGAGLLVNVILTLTPFYSAFKMLELNFAIKKD